MRTCGLAAVVSVLLSMNSCEKAGAGQNDSVSGPLGETEVRVLTRGALGADSSIPLRIFAFDAGGDLIDSTSVVQASGELSLKLYQGVVNHLVAVSANDDYVLPDEISMQSAITMRGQGGEPGITAGTPLQMGFADVIPSKTSMTAHIQMNYQVASVEFELSGLPENTDEVGITVSPISESVSMKGVADGAGSAGIVCSRSDDGVWRSGTVCVFPGSGQQTVFTIYIKGDDDVISSVTYQSALCAGVPYSLCGVYSDGTVMVTGSVSPSSWDGQVRLDFCFGPDVNAVIGNDEDSSENTEDKSVVKVSAIPDAFTEWEGHLVALVSDRTETSAILTLLSLRDWSDMTSAINTSTPDMARTEAESYEEYGMGLWSIPSEDEGKLLTVAYREGSLRDAILSIGCDTIALTKKSGNVLYLSENATRVFRFNANYTRDAAAGPTDYHLRLVRRVRVELE